MKKSKTKLAFSKSTISALENIRGGRSETSYSCPGDQCLTDAKTCVNNGPCDNTIR
ncbi:hypothetical protein IMCC3317_27240 [Kordia antarctica]|uniref:Uncharacterized protein n=1 Tax=Kordia antarctica TaxID=1218801 RepID=A0A7L4ZL78_9FLAO|nr:hypothetical protein [Kordia antarctica]QHI37345.1 hypothetical protein IMCC3317_27240 [Kordia antarctica]